MKRLLPLIFTLVMVIALIPAVFAEDAAEFSVRTNQSSSDVSNGYLARNTQHTQTGSGGSETAYYRWRAGTLETMESAYPVFDPDEEFFSAVAFKFNCAAAGKYIPTINYKDGTAGIIAEVHIASAAEDSTLGTKAGLEEFVRSAGASTRAGTVDFYTGSSAVLDEVSLSAETDYWVIFIAINENPARENVELGTDTIWYSATQYIGDIVFTPVEAAPEKGTETVYNLSSQAFNLSTEEYVSEADFESTGLIKYTGSDTSANTNRNALGGWVASTATITSAKIRDYETLKYDYIKSGENKWEYYERKNQSNLHAEKDALYMNFTKSNITSTYGVYLILKVDVPAKGKYNVSIVGTDVSTTTIAGAEADIAIANTVEGLDAVTTPWGYNFYEDLGKKELGTFEAEVKGDYYIRFKFKTPSSQDATESAKSYCGMRVNSITLEYVGEIDADAEKAANKTAQQNPDTNEAVADDDAKEESTASTVSLLKAFIGGDEQNTALTNEAAVNNGIYTVTADEAPDGYAFLYWAKGLEYDSKRIVSVSEQITFKPEIGGNFLIAVYGKKGDSAQSAKYFNANGQLLSDDSTPSMPGYSDFKGWAACGNNIFMAEYASVDSYKITVNNDDAFAESLTRSYGEEVTLTAPARADDGYRLFAYWEKEGEIVSLDRSYTFYAFEDCEVNAVYTEYEPAATSLSKIILTNIGGTNYMAEFIGFDSAVEKGIMVGTNRIAMTTGKTQFTINADVDGDVCGYAIDAAGNVYYSK